MSKAENAAAPGPARSEAEQETRTRNVASDSEVSSRPAEKIDPARRFMLERLAVSGLTEADGKAAGIRPDPKGRGFTIPYFDPADGKAMLTPTGEPFVRFRNAPPLPTGKDGRPVKYATPRNGGTHAFILAAAHKVLIADPYAPLFVTEGELKALAAHRAGLHVVAVPGITAWCESRATREDPLDLLPELARYCHEGRDIVFIYDSDARDATGRLKPQFDLNNRRLARALARHKARLFYIVLPPGEGAGKIGLDDYLLTHPAGDVKAMIDKATPVEPYEAGVTAADLLRTELPPVRWIVEPVLPEGLALLVGKSKLGKSWFALNIAVAVAAGGPAAGSWATTRGEVLYLALEDNARRMQGRLKSVLRGDRAPDGLSFWWTLPARDFDGNVGTVREWLQHHPEARLVIVDTLARMLPPSRRNGDAYRDDTSSMAALQALATERHVALVAVHHARKAAAEAGDAFDTVLGSTALMGVADTTMILRRARMNADAELLVTGRDVAEHHLALSFGNGLWRVEGNADEVATTNARRRILDVLRSAGRPLRVGEVAAATGKDKANASRVLAGMAADGIVARHGDSKYGLREEETERE